MAGSPETELLRSIIEWGNNNGTLAQVATLNSEAWGEINHSSPLIKGSCVRIEHDPSQQERLVIK